MTRSNEKRSVDTKTLLTVDEAAILLGITRSTAYRAIHANSFPVPVIRLGGRLRISRAALMRLLYDEIPQRSEKVEAGQVVSDTCLNCGGSTSPLPTTPIAAPRRLPICSAARRSSSGTESV